LTAGIAFKTCENQGSAGDPPANLLQAGAMVALAPYSSVIGSFARRIIGPASA
jgi:hypothetical protein